MAKQLTKVSQFTINFVSSGKTLPDSLVTWQQVFMDGYSCFVLNIHHVHNDVDIRYRNKTPEKEQKLLNTVYSEYKLFFGGLKLSSKSRDSLISILGQIQVDPNESTITLPSVVFMESSLASLSTTVQQASKFPILLYLTWNLVSTISQHDGVRTTMKKRYTQNSFKIHFQDAHGQSGWALELDLPQGPIKKKNNLTFFHSKDM